MLRSVLIALLAVSCGPATPQQLAVRSAADYAQNEAGLVTRATLERWLQSWASSKPATVKGELIVLQFEAAPGAQPWVASQPGVRTYFATELTRLMEPRNNGISAIGQVPADGIRIDSFMRRFNLHPNEDFVLFVTGDVTPQSFEVLSRAWLQFRYWGWNHENLGVLNDSISGLPEALRAAEVEDHPFTGATRISSIDNVHFSLLADVGAVRDAIGSSPLIDVRDADAFDGNTLGQAPLESTCLQGAPQCTPVVSGRIKSAKNLPVRAWRNDNGTLRALDELDALTTSLRRDEVAYLYDLDGTESGVAAFAALAIIGQPVRWYAASFIEWGSLNASHPETPLRALPTDSPWRTEDLTENAALWAEPRQGIRPLVFDPAASDSDGVQRSDAAYRENPPELPAVGAGAGGC